MENRALPAGTAQNSLAGTCAGRAARWKVRDCAPKMRAQSLYAVDGWFFAQRLSGIQRYATEILAELDKIAAPGALEVVVPQGVPQPVYDNLRVVVTGEPGPLWEQREYPAYLARTGRRWLCMCNVIPLRAPGRCNGIAVWHDVCYRARPDFYRAPRAAAAAAWHRLQYRAMAARARGIVTVSEFSKNEIMRYYGVEPGRITVIGNAWQHIRRTRQDTAVFGPGGKWPALQKGGYYFSMANLLKNKNFPWVLRAARNAPDEIFAIAGGGSLQSQARGLGLAELPNVVYLGYVSDGEAKALMANCKAFLFPTLYEGFGIPPLEAIACGAPRVLVSDTPCMREVYGPYASYIDLAANTGDVNAVAPPEADPAGILARYSWAESARRLAELLF